MTLLPMALMTQIYLRASHGELQLVLMTPVSSPLICQVVSCKILPDLTLYLLLLPYQMCVPAAVSFCTMFCTFRGLTLTSQETRRAWPLLYNLERASRLAPASFVCLDAATSEPMRPSLSAI